MEGEGRIEIAIGVLLGVALLPFVKFYALRFAGEIWRVGGVAMDLDDDEDGNEGPPSASEDAMMKTEDRMDALELRRQCVQGQWDFSRIQEKMESSISRRLDSSFATASKQLLNSRLDTGNQHFFEEWLDPHLQLSCAQFSPGSVDDLSNAQVDKMMKWSLIECRMNEL